MPNPVLNQKTFKSERAVSAEDLTAGWGAPGAPGTAGAPVEARTAPRTMTLNGTIAKTLVLLALLVAAGGFGWTLVEQSPNGTATMTSAGVFWFFGCLIGALVLAIITALSPKVAPFTAMLYALAEGVVVGVMSAFYNARFNGIVLQAVAATIGVFLVMLGLYTSRAIRVTPRMQKLIIGATIGVFFSYLLIWIASFFTNSISMFSSGPVGIVFSFIVAAIAASNLLLDFSFVEQGTGAQAPKVYEWYCGFGIMVTLVWLYLSILRLLGAARS